MDLLRFATAGSVDDGKSTLIGRLLYDTKSLFTDQLAAVEAVSAARGDEYTNLALLTDGLRAEREQGITIDVAYRYFATPAAEVHHRRHPGAHPVHPQHGHRRVHRRSGADPGGRPQGPGRAVPPARVPLLAAAGAAPGALRQQDGPGRLVAGGVRADRRRVHRVRREARRPRPDRGADLRAARRQHRQPLGEHALVRRAVAAAPPGAGAHRQRPQPGRRPVPGAVRDPPAVRPPSPTTGATPARSPPAC